jgi:hypothetical protein
MRFYDNLLYDAFLKPNAGIGVCKSGIKYNYCTRRVLTDADL